MKILFILAHPDDEAYGPAGTIAMLSKKHNVTVISLCDGRRPGAEHVGSARVQAFVDSCKLLGADWKIYDTPDCALTYDDTLKTIETLVSYHNPDIVYTHSKSDIHRDHRLVAECVLVACRPKPASTIKQIIACEMPASTGWAFGEFSPEFVPNYYVDIAETIDIKKQALSLYATEIYKFPDARSIEAVETLSKYRGYQSGFLNAEAFKIIFQKS